MKSFCWHSRLPRWCLTMHKVETDSPLRRKWTVQEAGVRCVTVTQMWRSPQMETSNAGGTLSLVLKELVSRGASLEWIKVVAVVIAPPAADLLSKSFPSEHLSKANEARWINHGFCMIFESRNIRCSHRELSYVYCCEQKEVCRVRPITILWPSASLHMGP